MSVVTRFAPSPTGFLHIGGARTALFNWLFARHHGGKYLLRIEDTDRARSTTEATEAIFDGLKWLGLNWDEDAVFQFSRAQRHVEVAKKLLDEGKAYYCYCTPAELSKMREEQKKKSIPTKYNGYWRDKDLIDIPQDVPPVIRLKAPLEGETTIKDLVQGEVKVANEQLDDMILLRSDGTPTYMLSVVVDDYDMGITHVIRGDDHLTNAFRQVQLYKACGWDIPEFAHIPLIHGRDGAKLSKRHGALGAEAYRDMGFLPEAVNNYLLKLGWGHGDDEIITMEKAIEWFDVSGIGKSPARFDVTKLTNINGHYIRETTDEKLVEFISPLIEKNLDITLSDDHKQRLADGMVELKERAKTILELAENSEFYVRECPLPINAKAKKLLNNDGISKLKEIIAVLNTAEEWKKDPLEKACRDLSDKLEVKLGKIAQPLRAALSGSNVSPPIFHVMEVLGKEETINRIQRIIDNAAKQQEEEAAKAKTEAEETKEEVKPEAEKTDADANADEPKDETKVTVEVATETKTETPAAEDKPAEKKDEDKKAPSKEEPKSE
ncbi:MAG: glutamate--tRNA ligase [Alphaproteobacteria bacterium]|nr:glutamate--tRNA ligase [Alphaproteobacteria bacterium]